MAKILPFLFFVLMIVSCQKTNKPGMVSPASPNATNTSSQEKIVAKINDRKWQSAAKTTSDTKVYLAAINSGKLQIKTFGSFVDSSGVITQDQLGIYIEGVTDTGTYTLSFSNYIVYNQLSETPQYFSSQSTSIGFVRITNLTDSSISGTFECQVDNTSGSGVVSIKEGSFANVIFQ